MLAFDVWMHYLCINSLQNLKTMKRTKKFNQEWAEAIALLPSNLQESITEAIRSYQNDGIVPVGLHPLAQALFIVICPTIDARARRSAYQKERRLRRNTSCLRPAKPKAVKATSEIPKAKLPEAPRCAEPEPARHQSPESPKNADAEPPSLQAPPRQPNRFLRQVEKARHKSRNHRKGAATGSRLI